ncbi:thermonuclease family protein [Agrobacterium genomosp. 3]|nr:thermonuclease family protein [Agrobacterium tomkonis]MCA1879741.1 thermonuclease family protein [Agrobacterium tumefaciens]MCA1894965.1 thermonuclease family protein [Agrobacterium tomkonis]
MYEAWWPAPVVTEPVLSPIDPVRTATPHVNVASAVPRTFVRCGKGFRVTCVVDGDTLWLNGQKIRIADIDTPEISSPGCRAEAQRGERAANRLVELLNKGPVAIRSVGDRDVDRFGRALRIVLVNEQNVGDFLIAEGLARPWEGQRQSWC